MYFMYLCTVLFLISVVFVDPALEFSSDFYVTNYSSHFTFLSLPLPFGVGGLILSDLFACFFFLPLLIYRKPAKVDFLKWH